jgi:trans-2,3-dihydro-3-hydroxyanthranilate isomerase
MRGVRLPFRLVDVFTDRALAGNQLCVFPDPADIPADVMQALALEIGFSETTFVTSAGGDRYSMRIFTPGGELPFAGHPTLGTAFALASEGRVSSPVTQSVQAGEIVVAVDVEGRSARMRQLPPTFGRIVDDGDMVARALGLTPGDLRSDVPPQAVSTGLAHLMVAANDTGAVARARPDVDRLRELLGVAETKGCYLFAVDGARARARALFADAGASEDAATGSAAGPLGAYLIERGLIEEGRLVVTQGAEIGRPSTLLVDVERDDTGGGGWRIFVGGGVVVVGSGEFDLTL